MVVKYCHIIHMVDYRPKCPLPITHNKNGGEGGKGECGGLSLYRYSNSVGFFPNKVVSAIRSNHVKSKSDSSSSFGEENRGI